ncbi:hypothetical protein BsWGS_18163 [Bradybaena similaris]
MIFPPLLCVALALLVSQTPVHCNDKATTKNLAKRTKREEVSTFGNDFTEQNHYGVPYLQPGSPNAFPTDSFGKSENMLTSYRPNALGKQYDDNYLSLLQLVPQYEQGSLLSPRDTRSRHRFFHSFVGKRDPEINANDRSDLLQFETENEDSDDSIDLFRRRVPQFSHHYIGKRQQPNTNNYNLLKRLPVQLFARRAPHFSHSFVGKRSNSGDGYSSNDISNVFSYGASHGYPYSNIEAGSTSWLPSSEQQFFQGNNFDNLKSDSPLQYSSIPSVHYLVKRASDMEKRSPSFGHSFVGKRAPRFGHSFVGKRAPHFGHSFVGKREEDAAEVIENALLNNDFEDDVNDPLVPEEGLNLDEADVDAGFSVDGDENIVKRQQRPNPNPLNFLGKRPSFTHSFVGKRAPEFGHSFVGKRAPGFGHSFVGKRAPGFGHSFVGKRGPNFGHSFVGKRAPSFGHSFIGKRAPGFGHSFVGKRAPEFGHSFVGKRGPNFGHSFVGKRPGFSHSFVGKRDDDSDYMVSEIPEGDIEFDSDEQENEEDIIGDILPELAIIAEQNVKNTSSLKETIDESKVGAHRNATPEAIKTPEMSLDMEKRAPRFGHSFVGKRAPGFGHSFVGKRAPSFGHSFVGKRAPRFGHSFVGKRAPGFGHSFVGKRAPRFGHSFIGKRAPRFGHSFIGKRAPGFGHSFVGKREDLTSGDEDNLVEENLTPDGDVEVADYFQTDGSVKDRLGDAANNDYSSKTSNV